MALPFYQCPYCGREDFASSCDGRSMATAAPVGVYAILPLMKRQSIDSGSYRRIGGE